MVRDAYLYAVPLVAAAGLLGWLAGALWSLPVLLLAFFFARDMPFPTLFRTIASLDARYPPFAFLPVVGLLILLIHLALYPWPSIFHQLRGVTPPTPHSI